MLASIISPVSRHLVVANTEQSLDFYTGKLGFSQAAVSAGSPPEAILGAARIIFHTHGGEVDSTGPLPSAGKAMIFFETDNVLAMYEELKKRGLNPSNPEKVNWIKMQLFCVVDPDGHYLWYGQSYHKHYEIMHTVPGKGQLRQIMPAFPCANVPEAVKYYVEVLGFSINYQQHDLGVMDRDEIRLLLVQATGTNKGTGSCCIYIRNADKLYAELLAKGAHIPSGPVSQPWGLREFTAVDNDGNTIVFAQTFE
ncbi:MAG: hypothetical protein E6Q24_16770 [Chitinophagaceae bacterium]|jgi:catechol 2,3-dioxygenase-like lactoylglutathione lyase family enzyme|nr:MAG: hypothetical protein E6Q24_16770 [Chitinophagaceae bacterium]